jgi:recombinational DNA repair protein (RecF pathway)
MSKKSQPIQETGTCAFCGKPYEHFGNNPYPLLLKFEQRVCDKCNHECVIPARMFPVKLTYMQAHEILKALGSHEVADMLKTAMSQMFGALGDYETAKAQQEAAFAQFEQAVKNGYFK